MKKERTSMTWARWTAGKESRAALYKPLWGPSGLTCPSAHPIELCEALQLTHAATPISLRPLRTSLNLFSYAPRNYPVTKQVCPNIWPLISSYTLHMGDRNQRKTGAGT